jgi:hypothetical protein
VASSKEIAEAIGIRLPWVRRLAASGRIPGVVRRPDGGWEWDEVAQRWAGDVRLLREEGGMGIRTLLTLEPANVNRAADALRRTLTRQEAERGA